MSAIWMKCTHCKQHFMMGMVISTPWPRHVCPDGTEDAEADFASPPNTKK